LYASFVSEWLKGKLSWVETTLNEVEEGLKQEVKPGDSESLKSVLTCIRRVKISSEDIVKMQNPLKDAALLLKRYNRPIEESDQRMLNEKDVKWETLKSNTYKIKEAIIKLQNEEVDKIKERVRK
jgi:hypothetical protein